MNYPGNFPRQKYMEGLDIGLPEWVARFAQDIYSGRFHLPIKRNKFDREKFSQQFDAEIEEIRNLLR